MEGRCTCFNRRLSLHAYAICSLGQAYVQTSLHFGAKLCLVSEKVFEKMMVSFNLGSLVPSIGVALRKKNGIFSASNVMAVADRSDVGGSGGAFPAFLPREAEDFEDPFARKLAQRIERVPVQLQVGVSKRCIMSSCVRPRIESKTSPVVLLHSFDSSCLEWRKAYPLLEEAGLEVWAIDVLGWGFSDLAHLPPCNVAFKRYHLYKLWESHIGRPMILVGPSLGASVAIDFVAHYPEAIEKLVLINPNAYAEGTGILAELPKPVAYAGVSLLKSFPLRFWANILAFNSISLSMGINFTKANILHCLMPWWKDATVDFMISGGYNVIAQIEKVNHKVLIVFGEKDKIVSYKLAVRLFFELPHATLREIPDCGHLPHLERPHSVAKLIADFALGNCI